MSKVSVIEKINRAKGTIKAAVTKIENFMKESVDSCSSSALEVKLLKIEGLHQKLDVLHNEFFEIPDISDLQEVEEDFDETENRLDELQVSVKSLLDSLRNTVKINEVALDSVSIAKQKVRLPEIPLPVFSGIYSDWAGFRIQFTNLIVNNEQLDKSQKLYYLRASLKGDAKHLESSDDDFDSLFEALRERYENKRLLVEAHISAIINYEKIHNEAAKELRLFIDCINKNIRALKVLEYNQNNLSDAILINIILQKLDKESRKQFEFTLETNEVPSFDSLMTFLEKRSSMIESVSRTSGLKNLNKNGNAVNKSRSLVVNQNKPNFKPCILCKGMHALYRCISFQNMHVDNRMEFVKQKKLCINCLRSHAGQCTSKFRCIVQGCNKSHNSRLHGAADFEEVAVLNSPTDEKNSKSHINSSEGVIQAGISALTSIRCKKTCAVLNTALIYINAANGKKVRLRALLDNGSSVNIIREDVARKLGIKLRPVKGSLTGISCLTLSVKYVTNAKISNEDETFSRNLTFSVVPTITDLIPVSKLEVSNLMLPNSVELADPKFHIPAQIDILIGSELFFDVLKADQVRTADGNCLLQSTVFGYLVTGSISQSKEQTYCCLVNDANLDANLKEFFELESIPGHNKELNKSEEELFCEEHFTKTYKRDNSGRFIVQLPLKVDAESVLGSSRETAVRRLNSIWNRLENNKPMAILYQKFMKEYEDLGHMEEINYNEKTSVSYVIPHHAVYRPESSSTPLRVVFDASAKTTSGHSLNAILCNGGIIQQDLFSIVVRFRKFRFAFSADIKKMYRQIMIDRSQRNLQRIVWKRNKDEPEKMYELCTVTYGTVSAPFLATRTLKALADEEKDEFPEAAEVICTDMYMDDILTGAATLEEAKRLQAQLIQLLHNGGMELHKWVSNNSQLRQDNSNAEYAFGEIPDQTTVKALGMHWQPADDNFTYKVTVNHQNICSKRDVLSQIARLYDPLGLICPIVTKAKIFLQGLWKLNLDWNEPLPSRVLQEWKRFLIKLQEVNNIVIPRYVLETDVEKLEIHGFSDASERAFGAVIYVRCLTKDGQYVSRLLCSKSRVAPIKTVSIPRLELCAALLLSRLVTKTVHALQLPIERTWLWTDSMIVVSWINTQPHKLKTFVSNRVAEIQALSEKCHWGHVASKDNPADVLSRGANASDLSGNALWWTGPEFLQHEITLPEEVSCSVDTLYEQELKKDIVLTITNSKTELLEHLFNRTNSFLKLIRICSYIFRFINLRKKGIPSKTLSVEELQVSRNFLVRRVQEVEFAAEITALKKGQSVPANSKLRSLDPFLDGDSLIRVGGRLKNSSLPFEAKHQIILPGGHKITKLIFEDLHKRYFHLGAQGLIHHIRLQYWPINGKGTARKVVHDCLECFKNKPRVVDQIMGNLPSERVIPNSPFLTSGVDFCGPFQIKYKNQRKGVYSKVYVAVFICMSTKAIHMETVTDLTSDAFIAALKRFCSRRGKISTIISDNATNFKGAAAELKRLKNLMISPDENLANYCSSESINWKFIPPRSPNFGGLWEAGVKSFKHHFYRTVGNSRLTLEEFETIVIQIEGILNSRPLTPLSDNVNEFEVLTPGHFLVGRPINAIPEPEIIDISDNRLSRWQRVTKCVQIIWKRWQRDYLNHLQQRYKWQFEKDNVRVGTLVLLKEDSLPPCKWVMARVLEVIPGKDNKIRVVRLKTATGIFTRGISKICVLPIETVVQGSIDQKRGNKSVEVSSTPGGMFGNMQISAAMATVGAGLQ